MLEPILNSARKAYSGPVKSACESTGVAPHLEEGYLTVANQVLTPHTVSIDGHEAKISAPKDQFWKFDEFDTYSERDLIKTILTRIGSDEVFYDIGAHIGSHACLIADAASHVVAFEPHAKNAAYLEKNLRMNTTEYTVKQVALSDESGTGKLVDRGGEGHTQHNLAANLADGSHEVPIASVDDLIEDGLVAPSIVKIDVQGAEYDVLKGMEKTIEQQIVHEFYVEVHLPEEGRSSIDDFGATEDDVLDILESNGYCTEEIDRRDNEYHLRAERT